MALIASDLADEMVAQLPAAWELVKGEDWPGGDTNDAKIMFLAVARGLLSYMEQHQNEAVSTVALGGGGAVNVSSLNLNIAPLPSP